ncbi:MAG: pectate lyase [Planctomycetaceae bacterium]
MTSCAAMTRYAVLWSVAVSAICQSALAESPAEKITRKPVAWFRENEGRTAVENLLTWQTSYGDWPKNENTVREPCTEKKKPAGTFDNGATVGELRVLARAYRATADERYKRAFLIGFDHILAAQYSHGGWPQFFPLSKKYHRHVTFNDGTMIRLMEFLRDAPTHEDFAFLDDQRRSAALKAVEKGIECILRCQVVVQGDLTVWCAQHDAETLAPVQARSYELPSLSGAESAGVLRFLMSIEHPDPRIIRAVKAGVEWFEKTKIEGYRYQRNESQTSLIPEEGAAPLWARFYEIETNRPIFSDRDGVVKYDLQQIGSERRNGYTWYGDWGASVLKTYSKWPHR